ncbi:MAG: response regulator [Arcobacter sp.]|nr:response regulator [Arcobacter sp.]
MHEYREYEIISIDANKTNLLIIESYAKILKLNISSFLNPLDAVDELEKNDYDLIIVDYMMPEMNGIEVIQRLEKNETIPIIMLTAVGDDMELQIKALEVGANDFLNKPINAPAFKARIINMLKLRKAQLLI